MPRRRLSERQLERIRAIQERRRQRLEDRRAQVLADPSLGDAHDGDPGEGLVVVRHGANLAVEDDSGALQHCVTRRNIGHPVCGDRVIWQPAGDGTGVVTALLPRDNVLSRPDFSGRDKPLAANLSLLAVVIAPKPPPSGYLVDQYLVAAELIGVRALLVAGKMDLLDAEAQSEFLADLAHYEAIGYPVCPISTKGEPGLDALTRHLADETAILLGQSGVGKSSLVNRLLPDQEVQIGRLSKATGLGRHTTSAATCYRLPAGGRLIDSPGVRSFRLVSLTPAELERGFRDLAPLLGRCRFRDCRHLNEPDCAVRAAVDSGAIDGRRVENFRHLRERLLT
jgi:ribosome biogenesis GTPase